MTTAKRIAELHEWATRRIEQCQRLELKFAKVPIGKGPYAYPVTVHEAVAERHALQTVLQILGKAEP